MTTLQKLRKYFNEWQEQGHYQRPEWYDAHIDTLINSLTNVELLELIEVVNEAYKDKK